MYFDPNFRPNTLDFLDLSRIYFIMDELNYSNKFVPKSKVLGNPWLHINNFI